MTVTAAAVTACLATTGIDGQDVVVADLLDLSSLGVVDHPIRCQRCRLAGGLRVADVTFTRAIDFDVVLVDGDVDARGATFQGPVLVRGDRSPSSRVTGTADFSLATFEDATTFDALRFDQSVDFDGARFESSVSFEGTDFGGDVRLERADVEGFFVMSGPPPADLSASSGAVAGRTTMSDALFHGTVDLSARRFTGGLDARGATFTARATVANATIGSCRRRRDGPDPRRRQLHRARRVRRHARRPGVDPARAGGVGEPEPGGGADRPVAAGHAGDRCRVVRPGPAPGQPRRREVHRRADRARPRRPQQRRQRERRPGHPGQDRADGARCRRHPAGQRRPLPHAADRRRAQPFPRRQLDWVFYEELAGYLVRPLRPLRTLLLLILVGTVARYLVDDYRERQGQLVLVGADTGAMVRKVRVGHEVTGLLQRLSRAIIASLRAKPNIPSPVGETTVAPYVIAGLRLFEYVISKLLIVVFFLSLANYNATLREVLGSVKL